jgi:dUTPase
LFACQWIPPSIESTVKAPGVKSGGASMFMSYLGQAPLVIEKGERIGQLIPVKRQEMRVSALSNEELDAAFKERGLKRGAGGFGSTGK